MRTVTGVAIALVSVALAGCGVGAGEAPEDVGLRVTDRFATDGMLDRTPAETAGEDTVARLLQRNAKVETSSGGNFVASIDGRAGGEEQDGSTGYWVFFRNGVFSDRGAADVQVRSGDRIWWDRFDERVARVRAVVGSFPMPFAARDDDGEPVSVTLGCVDVGSPACTVAAARLDAAGVAVTAAALRPQARPDTLRLLVGPWSGVRRDPVAARLERDPRVSGVFAQLRGTQLIPYGPKGLPVEPVRESWGLVAALRSAREPVTWVVTGRTAVDAEAAAEQLTAAALKGRLATLLRGGTDERLPVTGGE